MSDSSPKNLIGTNLKAMRGSMSQKELAKAMRSRNYRWNQATVWTVEQGERQLKLEEANDVADILGAQLGDFFDTSVDVKKARAVFDLEGELQARSQTVAEAVRDLRGIRAQIEQAIQECRDAMDESDRSQTLEHAAEYGQGALDLYTVESAVSRGKRAEDLSSSGWKRVNADTSEG